MTSTETAFMSFMSFINRALARGYHIAIGVFEYYDGVLTWGYPKKLVWMVDSGKSDSNG